MVKTPMGHLSMAHQCDVEVMNCYCIFNVRRRTRNVNTIVENTTPIRKRYQTGTGNHLPMDINAMSSPA